MRNGVLREGSLGLSASLFSAKLSGPYRVGKMYGLRTRIEQVLESVCALCSMLTYCVSLWVNL